MPKSSPVTMRDVALAAGVSTMTVSRALRSDSPVSEKTRSKILKVVEELNYVPDQLAGSLSSKRSGFVAVLVPSLNNLHFAQTVQALTGELEKARLQILLGHTDYSPEREERLVEAMLRRRPEALVLSYDGHTDRTIALLEAADIPIVQLWERPGNPINHTIGISNEKASFEMTTALIQKGYSNITFLGEPRDQWNRGVARRHGFMRAMEAASLDPNRIVQHGAPPMSIEDGAAAAALIRERFPDTDCLYCVSDMPAYGAMMALRAEGLDVPGDIGIAGFGNFEISRFSAPALTTVAVDPLRIGVSAGQLIARLIADPASAVDDVQVNIKAELCFRGSTR